MPAKPPVHRPFGWRPPEQAKRDADRARGSRHQRGYDWTWVKRRDAFLKENPLCAECQRQGFVTAANTVDHIVPHRGNAGLFNDQANWQSLCARHHNEKTGRGE